MGADQYHEPPETLPEATKSFVRVIASLVEEAEAIGWYEQRLAVETDEQAKAIMREAQTEECRHFSMDLEWLMRHLDVWARAGHAVLFKPGDIVANYKAGEEQDEPSAPASNSAQKPPFKPL